MVVEFGRTGGLVGGNSLSVAQGPAVLHVSHGRRTLEDVIVEKFRPHGSGHGLLLLLEHSRQFGHPGVR